MRRKNRKRKFAYFEVLGEMATGLAEGVQTLRRVLFAEEQPRKTEERQRAAESRARAFANKHTLAGAVAEDFLPPLDGADLLALAEALDGAAAHLERAVGYFAGDPKPSPSLPQAVALLEAQAQSVVGAVAHLGESKRKVGQLVGTWQHVECLQQSGEKLLEDTLPLSPPWISLQPCFSALARVGYLIACVALKNA